MEPGRDDRDDVPPAPVTAAWLNAPQWSPAEMTGMTSEAGIQPRQPDVAAMEPGRDDRDDPGESPADAAVREVPQWSPAEMTGMTPARRRGARPPRHRRNGARPR